jgi:hypothetical protein
MATNTVTTTSGVTYTLRDLWVKACQHDGIDPEGKFVVFSIDNPWMAKYSTLMALRYKQGQYGKRRQTRVTADDEEAF